jgi:hypothetical protein
MAVLLLEDGDVPEQVFGRECVVEGREVILESREVGKSRSREVKKSRGREA